MITTYTIIWILSVAVLILTGTTFYFLYQAKESKDKMLQLANKENFFEKKTNLLRKDETGFFYLLQKLMGNDYHLFPQIHLSDLIEVKNSFKDHDNLFQILGHKTVDYVIFTKSDFEPKLVIELDGKSHNSPNRSNKDALKYDLFEKIDLNIISVDKNHINANELKNQIFDVLNKN